MNSHSAALRRRDEILKVIRGGAVHSQEELQHRLQRRGIDVAQPTLSRDIKDLGLAKTSGGYVVPGDEVSRDGELRARREERLERALREWVLGVATAGNLVVVKTPPAAANPVARALDEAELDEVVGTIAGDDTIFLAALTAAAAQRLARRLEPAPAAGRARRGRG